MPCLSRQSAWPPGKHGKCLAKSACYPKLQMWRSWLAMFSFLAPERLKPHREPSLPLSPSTCPALANAGGQRGLGVGPGQGRGRSSLHSSCPGSITRERQRANESWTVSKLGDTLASGMRSLCLPSLFGRKRSKQGRATLPGTEAQAGASRQTLDCIGLAMFSENPPG